MQNFDSLHRVLSLYSKGPIGAQPEAFERPFANSLQIAADKDCRMRDSDHGALVMDWNLFAGTSSLKESIGRIFTKGILTEGTLTGASEVHGF